MDTKFRPLPLSVIDFFGVIVPGFIWLMLLVTTLKMLNATSVVTPMTAWVMIVGVTSSAGVWLGPSAVMLTSIVIGYSLKARATYFATPLAAPWLRLEPALKGVRIRDAQFPYTSLHQSKPYYESVVALTTSIVGCPVETLPGYQPFGAAKRLLRIIAPPLWEELEHREAEIRLLAGTLTAAAFSLFLASVQITREILSKGSLSIDGSAWLLLSALAFAVMGDAFNHLRLREVAYAYMYLLIANGIRQQGISSDHTNFAGLSE